MGFEDASRLILGEIEAALAKVDRQRVAQLEEAIVGARAVFVTGEGRSGLVGRCFAMRLMHLGVQTYMVGGTTTPAIGKGDLLVALSGAGETDTTCALAHTAAEAGAAVAALTAAEGSSLASEAELLLIIAAPTKDGGTGKSEQYGGSVFEQSLMILLDAVALELQRRLGETPEEMGRRHANLE